MNPEVFLTAADLSEDDVRGRTVVVVDVLLAGSVIAAALDNGARAVVPVADLAEAGKLAANMDTSAYLTGGERGGNPIDGYHLGASPREYARADLDGRTVVYHSSHGTSVIAGARAAETVVVASLLNVSRVGAFLREQTDEIVIVCAGWGNRVALEDTLCAGMLLQRLWDGRDTGRIADGAHIALSLFERDAEHLERSIRRSSRAHHLAQRGDHEDVDFCLRVDAIPVLPELRDGQLVAA